MECGPRTPEQELTSLELQLYGRQSRNAKFNGPRSARVTGEENTGINSSLYIEGLQWRTIRRSQRVIAGLPNAFNFFMSKKNVSASLRKKLEQAAVKVMKNAHAPYSKFHVGAAILLTNGKIFAGCNVENASYGMTNCAERTAIFSAVAELGPKIEIQAVAVANDHGVACSPCGACRQVIYEFGPDATIFFLGATGPKQAHITELLPDGFRLQ